MPGVWTVPLPVPDSATECGLPLALSAMFKVADRAPVPLGVKTTLMVAVPPLGATLIGVNVVVVKSEEFVPPNERLLRVSVAVPGLVTVISCAALLTPGAWAPKVSDVGFRLIAGEFGAAPVPDSATVWGLPAALSPMFNVAERAPVPLGVNFTLMVAVPPPEGTVIGIAVVVWKSPALAPLNERVERLRFAVPGLVTVINCGTLLVFSVWLAKVRLAGLRLIAGAPVPITPLPVIGIMCGVSGELSLTISVACRGPCWGGVKVTLMVAVPLGGTVIGLGEAL